MIVSCEEIKKNYPHCTSCSNGSKIVVKENKRKYVLQNPSGKEICTVRIDGCVISSQKQAKCDFMIIVCNTRDVYFIELKGRDIFHGVEQLNQTIDYFKNEIHGKVFVRIVVSKVVHPKATIETDARVKRLKDKFKKFGGNFEYISRVHEKDDV